MTDEKVNLAVIEMFSLVQASCTVKFLWSPFLDRYIPPFLGRRRDGCWSAKSFSCLPSGHLYLVRPAESPWIVAILAVIVSFFSASRDIVTDAYRRELLRDEEPGLGASFASNGYRIGMPISGAFAYFWLTASPGITFICCWPLRFSLALLLHFMGQILTDRSIPPKTLREAVIEPLPIILGGEGHWKF